MGSPGCGSSLRPGNWRNLNGPAVGDITRAFAAAGFSHTSLATITEISASSPLEYCDRIKARADSTLSMITDDDFERGLAAMRAAAEREPPAPVLTRLDLLVMRAPSPDEYRGV
jgi:hypothetical protein